MMLGIDWNDMESSHYLSILSVNHVSLSCLLTYHTKQDLALSSKILLPSIVHMPSSIVHNHYTIIQTN
eukprot:scaffold48224_cov45-Cyclotella_meneghiniana.AAC.2